MVRCPSCRIQFNVADGGDNLMRNIPMEKLARSFYERRMQQHRLAIGLHIQYSQVLSLISALLSRNLLQLLMNITHKTLIR